MRKPIHLFAALGFASTVGQVLLMRELVVVFYGNELSLGIMLGSWLFWVGIGSLLAALLLPRLEIFNRLSVLAALQTLLGLTCVGTLACVRAVPLLLHHSTAGEIVGYMPIIISSFLVLAPMCLLLGFSFDLYCHMWSSEPEAPVSIGSVYMFEAIGSAIGGIAFAGVLVWALDPTEIVFVLLVLNLAASASALALERPLRPVAAVFSLLAVLVMTAAFLGGADSVRKVTMSWLWRGLPLRYSEDSIYGNIALTEQEEQKTLYENGLLMFSHPDRFSAEEAVHFGLLEHPSPKRVLLIGGGVSGSLNEVLKHPVEHVDYLELDPLIIRTVRKFFPPEITGPLEDPRVSIHTVDGRLFVKKSRGTYDVIIVNLPDPYTALINRFYTLEFFKECRDRLAPDGILSFRVNSSEDYISPELQQFLGCLNKTLTDVFPNVKVVPGQSNVFLACSTPGILTLNGSDLIARLNERGIREKLFFIREYYLPDRLSEAHQQTLASALESAEARVNTDLAPVCYYYDAVLWSKQFKDISSAILASFSRVRPYWVAVAIAVVFALALLTQRLFPLAWGQKSILVAVGTTGFAQIAMQVITLLGFQAIHGYVYYKVAIIITAFMVGLAAGAALMGRAIKSGAANRRTFILVQAGVCLYPLILLGALLAFSRSSASDASARMFALQGQAAFPLLAFFAGLVGGLQFPLANALWLAEKPGVARAAGYTYGIDLLGSCLGAMLTTAVLIPVFGIPFACITAGLLNLGSLLLLISRPSI